MGSKQTFVGTQVARVIPDDRLPDSVRTGLSNALFQDGEIIDHVLEEMISNVGIKAERLYEFAKNGNYVHGLPSGQFKVVGDALLPAVKAQLETIHGRPVTMSYAEYGPPNSLHIGWMALMENHGYDPVTNRLGSLTISNGHPTYLHDMVVSIPPSLLESTEMLSLKQWGVSASAGFTEERIYADPATADQAGYSQVEIDINASEETVKVTYSWTDSGDELQRGVFNIPTSGYDDSAMYIHARYTVEGVVKYVMYRVGAGTYPALDQLFDASTSTNGQFFPFLYFRYNGVSELADTNTESYRDNVKLAKYLGMNYDQVAEGVDANPDIDDVEQAMIMFAVPANTEDQQERAYLWKFFNNLFLAQGSDLRFRSEAQADIASSQLFGSSIQPPGIVIQDKRFKLSLSNRGIYRTYKTGTVAPVGEYSSGVSTFNVPFTYLQPETQSLPATQVTIQTPVKYHYFRRQATVGLYEEIQVVDLQTRFHIFGKYSTIGDELDKILLIPLDHSITESFSIPQRERLYARSLHYVFNSLVVLKLKWYQTELFQAVLLVVAMAITVFSWGADGGSAIAAALSVGAYVVAFNLIFIAILEFLILRLVFKLFVKAVGIKAAFVIAIIAALAGVSYGLMDGGIAGSPWAENLLSLASNLGNAINTQIQVQAADLNQSISEFDQYVKEQTKLLESAQGLLDQDHRLSPFVIFGEKPDDFYSRTVHSGNIGIVGIDAVASFVESRLTLPKLDETIGAGMSAATGDW